MNLIELKYTKGKTKSVIKSYADCKKYVSKIFDIDTIDLYESVFAIFLDNNLNVLGHSKLSFGGSNKSIVDIKHLCATAILCNSSGVIVAHNHPSGTKRASISDLELKALIEKSLGLFGICLTDFVIAVRGDVVSV